MPFIAAETFVAEQVPGSSVQPISKITYMLALQ